MRLLLGFRKDDGRLVEGATHDCHQEGFLLRALIRFKFQNLFDQVFRRRAEHIRRKSRRIFHRQTRERLDAGGERRAKQERLALLRTLSNNLLDFLEKYEGEADDSDIEEAEPIQCPH